MANRDNISGVSKGILVTIFLLPGYIIQWFLYILPGPKGKRGYAHVRSRTRLSRSPIMTYILAIIGWIVIAVVFTNIVLPSI